MVRILTSRRKVADAVLTPRKSVFPRIFILEGIVTVLCGVITAPFLPRNAQAARFLSADEKELHQQLMDNDGLGEEENEKFSWKECGKAVLSPHVWMMAVGGFFSGMFEMAVFTSANRRHTESCHNRLSLTSYGTVWSGVLCTIDRWNVRLQHDSDAAEDGPSLRCLNFW